MRQRRLPRYPQLPWLRRLPSLWLYEGDRRVSTDTRDIVARLQTRIAR